MKTGFLALYLLFISNGFDAYGQGSVHCQIEADGQCHCGPRRGTGRNIPCTPSQAYPDQNHTNAGESDCLPQVDPAVLERLRNEKNALLRTLAEGGYATDLTLSAMGKLIAARLQHLTEPNEGIAVRTLRQGQSAAEHAPETVLRASQAVADYLANDNAANHRYLYGRVQTAIQSAEQDLRQRLRNPHVAIATIADELLVGKFTGAGGTVCRQWSAAKVTQLKNKIAQSQQAAQRAKAAVKEQTEMPSIKCAWGGDNDCMAQSMAYDKRRETGYPWTADNFNWRQSDQRPSWPEAHARVRALYGDRQFAGHSAARARAQAAGVATWMPRSQLETELLNAGFGARALVGIKSSDSDFFHMFHAEVVQEQNAVGVLRNKIKYWDEQGQTEGMQRMEILQRFPQNPRMAVYRTGGPDKLP